MFAGPAASIPGRRNVRADAVHGQKPEHEENALPQIRNVENVLYGFDHRLITSTVPPAFVIFSRALSVK